jgi:uncharacterized protein (DUF1697 family)
MAVYVALLRAVNVGGTGKLAMADLKALCEAAGFARVRTYIASGNVLFQTGKSEKTVKATLEARLQAFTARRVGVVVRNAAEMAAIVAANPFADAPGNRVVAIFLDAPPAPTALNSVTGLCDGEELALGTREIYVRYGAGMGSSKLRIPAARDGTARNMNTIARLASLAAE